MKRLMITNNLATKIQNLAMNHESQPAKWNLDEVNKKMTSFEFHDQP